MCIVLQHGHLANLFCRASRLVFTLQLAGFMRAQVMMMARITAMDVVLAMFCPNLRAALMHSCRPGVDPVWPRSKRGVGPVGLPIGRHLVHTWSTLGLHFGYIWSTLDVRSPLGLLVVQNLSMRSLRFLCVCSTGGLGPHTFFACSSLDMRLVCAWSAPGVRSVCAWSAFRPRLVYTWCSLGLRAAFAITRTRVGHGQCCRF